MSIQSIKLHIQWNKLSKYQQNFCGKRQVDSKIYIGMQNIENSCDNIDKQSLNT